MSINPTNSSTPMDYVNGANPAGSDGASSPFVGMSGNALADFLKFQLEQSNGQIQNIEDQMTKQDNLNSDLSNLSGTLSQYSQGITDDPNGGTNGVKVMTPDEVQQYRNSVDAYCDQAVSDAGGPNTPEGQQILSVKQSFDSGFGTSGNTADSTPGTLGSDNKLSADDIASLTQNVKNIQQNVNSNTQMNMINLQSLMSGQTTYVQLSTNMEQSQDDAKKSIADNIGK